MSNDDEEYDAATAIGGPGGGGTGPGKQQVVEYTERSQDKHESRHIQMVREYGFNPRSKVSVEDGAMLPKKFEPFPEDMYGKPLEEIDNFIYEETFCVVSKRFRKNYIHRFTGTKSCFLFEPWSPWRRACVAMATNQYFDYIVMATILLNCVFLAMTETVEEAEYIFLIIYTAEMVIKIIAKGFLLNKYTYLRNPWNWLDFVVITSGYTTILIEMSNLAGLRTFRVLRALKTISIMPGLKTIINALLHSFRQLAEVMTLTIFCLMVFALFALQVYMGELRNKCVRNMPDESTNVTYEEWYRWINDTQHWIYDANEVPLLCGNLTGARHCPTGHTCLCIGENPNHGYTSFDNFMWSMLTTFQLITLDYWENVYNMILATSGPMSVSFFTVVVFFGSFYLINLMLAVVALAYEEEAEITLEERRKDLLDHRDDSTFSFDPSQLSVKQLTKNSSKRVDKKNMMMASYSRKKIRRRKTKSNAGNGSGNAQNRSVTPSPSPSPRHSSTTRPPSTVTGKDLELGGGQQLMQPGGGTPLQPQEGQERSSRGVTIQTTSTTHLQNPNTLHPLAVHYRGQLMTGSRQTSSNSEGGVVNRESSLDDSGVVDDHDEGLDFGAELLQAYHMDKLRNDMTPVTLALSPKEVRIIKCNGNVARLKKHNVYELHPEYLSQIVVLDDLPDRNCNKCVQCCVDYEGWLQFQNFLYKVVKDPLFELAITLCIVLNTMFLALEHHGMSESVRQALDIGNKVFTSIFTFECILKLMALSKDYFLCGWNIFDLIIVSASLLDIIFELVDGLSVLRGLRLLRVLKLAQSWTTMKVLLSIIISTIGALGNLTLVLVIVIYIFAVIGMQLFSKDYVEERFYPDPVPRWNFNDFFHSFMMIFRILCGEWIEPLWDCMRAEGENGASTCFAIFLPTLVMGNFMVLNLFLALLLNSFNSEELKSKKEEVGEDSKLARSFERIRSIVRRRRLARKEKKYPKLEQIVNDVMAQQIAEKKRIRSSNKHYLTVEFPQKSLYRHSYQESLNRPVSGSDFGFDIPLKTHESLKPITGSAETLEGFRVEEEEAEQLAAKNVPFERKFLHQMSSGFGTQQNDSREDPTLTESIELRALGPINSTDTDPGLIMTESEALNDNNSNNIDNTLGAKSPATSNCNDLSAHQEVVTGGRVRHAVKLTQAAAGQSVTLPPISSNISDRRQSNMLGSGEDHALLTTAVAAASSNPVSSASSTPKYHRRWESVSSPVRRSPSYMRSMNRIPSDNSIQSLSTDRGTPLRPHTQHSESGTPAKAASSNLREELLNCEQKELFQFLNEDFDHSNNYFSDTVGFGAAAFDPDTDSLVFDGGRGESSLASDRKVSTGSMRSNLSSISNSIFQTLEMRRGGSFSGSIDKVIQRLESPSMRKRYSDNISQKDMEREPLVGNSEFDCLIESFDKSLTDLKNKSCLSLDRNISKHLPCSGGLAMNPEDLSKSNSSSNTSAQDTGTVIRRARSSSARNFDRTSGSVKLKRRSLEKQKKVHDEEFEPLTEGPSVLKSPPQSNGSPTMRIRRSFNNSYDRIKRSSLIERVEEEFEGGERMPLRVESEKLPRKEFKINEDLLKKRHHSDENVKQSTDELIDKLTAHPSDLKELPKSVADSVIVDIHPSVAQPELVESPSSKSLKSLKSGKSSTSSKKSKKRKKSPKSDKKRKQAAVTIKPWHQLVTYVDDLTVGGRRNSQGCYEDQATAAFPMFGDQKPEKVPQDCFPPTCYERMPCFAQAMATPLGRCWRVIRRSVLAVVDTPAFEWFVLVLIFASSITLCFEDIHLDANKPLKRILYWTNLGFCLIFIIEMFLKWIALGFTKYFSSFWTILDFVIVFVSVFSLLIEENENLRVLRSLRTLRALRPLRAISRWQGMRIVVNALMYAIPSIFNVLLVCLVFWLIFSIMGVQFFGGKFFKCIDADEVMLDIDVVNDRDTCLYLNYSWVNSKITFDHVGMGYLALLQVATFEGWMEVMEDAVDARGVDLQPQREANLYAYIYFVIFIVCGSFFTLNLFIGVIIDNFNMLKKKYEGGVLEMFLTESQKHYYTAMKKLGRKKPQKVIKRPLNPILGMFYDLSNSRRFEIAIFVLIFLNMLSMGIEHYGQPVGVFFVLEVSNAFFTTVFGLECIVKIIGLRYHYFTVPWNVFDFLLVLASILGILMEDIMIDLPVSPTLLRVVRVFRIGRILRLIKAAKGIRKLLFALVVSLPALFNIGALLALITFIYAILGMSLFGHVKLQGALNDMVNFQTFGRSMQLLFRLMTSAGWNDVLESLMIQPPHCNPTFNHQQNGDCGHPLLAITYFTSFIIISYMIVINMYIAIILENFNQAHQEEEIGIVEDDLEMFYIRWSKYDPHATQFIHFSQLSDFIASLDPPLGISKPNTVALVSFNLPISKGNKIHCLDILHALVKHVLGHVEETDNFKQLQEQMDVKFKKQFPTRKELEIVSSTRIWKRQDKAARLIQLRWRDFLRIRKDRDRSPMSCEDEHNQTSSPGGWQAKLQALNFLNLQGYRRRSATSMSRCSSRKSSRCSDGSDMSEMAGPWLNLPLMLVSGTGDLKDIKVENQTDLCLPEQKPSGGRRRSFYNLFLGRQDAVDDSLVSPSAPRKAVTPSGHLFSLNAKSNEDSKSILSTQPATMANASSPNTTTSATVVTPKSKRATSFIRKKPPLERGLSAQSALRVNKNAFVSDGPASEVSITVTKPSPEAPLLDTAKLVHVLVHRESEEYNTSDVEENVSAKIDYRRPPEIKISPGSDDLYPCEGAMGSLPESIVKIMVESPKDPPQVDYHYSFPGTSEPIVTPTSHGQQQQQVTEGEIRIDVNMPVDSTNLFYEYEDQNSENKNQS